MNEKIKQLAVGAGIGFTLWDDSGREMIDNFTPEEYLEKFAKLIVKECIAQAVKEEERYDSLNGRDCDYCSMAMANFQVVLAKHFGVEE